MITQLRLFLLVARPAVVFLLALFTATGLAQAGHGEDRLLLARALAAVIGFLVFSVACNDLADEAIDRVNLPGDARRPLVSGAARRRDLVVTGVTGAGVALAMSATLHRPAVAVVASGLALSAGYSLRPLRVADRGVLASLLLPACYVAVPYLLGIFAARPVVHRGDLLLLAGLYVGFIGRILLKDFRDVRGDALFGKRTFLVRHGRRPTCAVSAACWAAGAVALPAAVQRPTPALVAIQAAVLAVALGLLRALARDRGPRRDERLIAAIAIMGRGMVLVLLAHLSFLHGTAPAAVYGAVMGVLAAVILGQAAVMARRGPAARLTVRDVVGTSASGGSRPSGPSGPSPVVAAVRGSEAAGR